MSSLSQRLTSRIDADLLTAIAPRVYGPSLARQQRIIADFGACLPDLLERFEVNTPLRIAHLLAQVAKESDAFCALEEYASGEAYESRKDLGNTRPGDGKRYKGRGLIQLTGRANYRTFTVWMRKILPDCPDFESVPEHVANFPWAVWTVFYYWSTRKLNQIADRDDLVALTKVVNGGRNGLADRARYLAKAKTEIARLVADDMSGRQQFATLRRGMSGPPIERLQRALQAAGFYLLAIDDDFGPGTEGAVKLLQRARGLTVDGIVGRDTDAVLSPYYPTEKEIA